MPTRKEVLFPQDKYYAKCKNTARLPKVHVKNEAVIKSVIEDFSILPLAEKSLLDYRDARYYSLVTNEYLRCRWGVLKKNLATAEEKIPLRIINLSDEHFHNHCVRLMPELDVRLKDHRRKLRPGPGVDQYGQIPVPVELCLKRGLEEPKPDIQTLKKKREEKRRAEKDATKK